MEPTLRTDIQSVFGMMFLSALRAGLASVCRIYIHNIDSGQPCLVLNEHGHTIKAPIVETVIVFTTCPCRLSNAGKRLQLNGADILFNGFMHNGTTDFMVLVSHPTLLFISGFANRFLLFRFSQLFATLGISTAYKFVLTTIAIKLRLAITGYRNGRALDTKVNAHDSLTVHQWGLSLFIGNLRDILVSLLGDTKCASLGSRQNFENLIRDDGGNLHFPGLAIHKKWHSDIIFAYCIVLVIPNDNRFLEKRELAIVFRTWFGYLVVNAFGIKAGL